MTPDEAARLKVGDRVFVTPDSLLRGLPGGIYTIKEITTGVQGGRIINRFRITDDETLWARPHHLGRISRGQ